MAPVKGPLVSGATPRKPMEPRSTQRSPPPMLIPLMRPPENSQWVSAFQRYSRTSVRGLPTLATPTR